MPHNVSSEPSRIKPRARLSTPLRTLFALVFADLATMAAHAQTPPLDPQTVEAFLDSKIEPALRTSGVPGAVVAVVRREGNVLVKGYGVSDIVTRKPVDGNTTLFNIASMGKGMSAILVQQLVEEGVLDLDVNVNQYLKSAHVSGPEVTLRMLLGHRGGFDDNITGLFVPLDGDTSMTKAELDRRLHPLVPPGYVSAYDNQGYGVIGLILTDVTGKSFADLYRDRLFEPTGMTGAAQGRPKDGDARLARCYTVQGPGSVQECKYPLYRDGLRGAGGVAASGADMARYLRLLLNQGTLDGTQVLSGGAFADLTNFDHYRFHPGMPGVARGFIQFEDFRGFEYAGGGSIPGFSSLFIVYPEADVAIFVSYMGGQVGSFDMTFTGVIRALQEINVRPDARPGFAELGQIIDHFAERFIPGKQPRSSEAAKVSRDTADDGLEKFLGTYVSATDHSRTFTARLAGWIGGFDVQRSGADSIRLGGPGAPLGMLHRVGPLLYEGEKGSRVAFTALPIGNFMAVGLSGGTFRQTNALESPAWSVLGFAVALILALTAFIQLRRGAPAGMRTLSKRMLIGFALVLAGLIAEWQWGVASAVVRGEFVLPAIWRIALHVGAVLMLWAGYRYLRSRDTQGSWLLRSHGALLVAVAFAVPLFLLLWRVLGAFPPWLSW